MKIANELKVGILAIVSLTILILGYNYLRGKKVFSSQNQFYAVYDRVDGLLTANPVQINGFQVGIVDQIYLKEDLSGQIIVSLLVDEKVKLPKATKAKIMSLSMLGDKGVELLIDSDPFGKNGYASDSDTLGAVNETNLMKMAEEQLIPIKDKVEVMVGTLDSTLKSFKTVLGSREMKSIMTNIDKSVSNVEHSIRDLENIIGDLSDFTDKDLSKVGNILANVDDLSQDLNNNSHKITKVLDNTEKLTTKLADADLDKTLASFDSTLKTANTTLGELTKLTNQISDGEGTIGALMQDKDMYQNLEDASKSLNQLLLDFKANPKDFVGFSLININKKDKKKKSKDD